MQNYGNRRPGSRRKKPPHLGRRSKMNMGTILQIVILGGFVIVISILLLSSVEKGRQENSGLGNVIAAETMEKNNQTADGGKAGTETAELTIDNISITGLSREEAKN